ncbi:restriction endonuclease subunit S [Mesoflavibacter sp.]|uniref:restriction endonuclease subunit S n=1 Tax=Mesoflavibacter sp. TaxID=1930902 RepID=UPI0035176287
MGKWKEVSLNDILEIQRGGSPRPISKYITESEDGINWIKIGDVKEDEKYITETKQKITRDGISKSRVVTDGDFILSNSMSFGRPYIVKTTGCVHDGWLILRIKDEKQITKDFLYTVLGSNYVYQQFSQLASGTTVKNLNSSLVKKVKIKYPPLPEQQRIVAKLDGLFAKIDQAISLLEANLQHTQALMGSVLDEEFGRLEASSKIVAISKIADVKGGKRLPKGKKLLEEKTKYPYIRVSDFTDHGTIDLEGLKFISKEIHEQISRYTITSDDLYISIAGTIGKTGIIPEELNGANLTENAAKLVYKDKSTIDNLFVYFYTLSDKFKAYVENSTKQVAQPKLALTRLKEIKIALPSIEKQKEVVQKFKSAQFQINKLEETQTQKLNHLKALKSSLLDQAFKGEL